MGFLQGIKNKIGNSISTKNNIVGQVDRVGESLIRPAKKFGNNLNQIENIVDDISNPNINVNHNVGADNSFFYLVIAAIVGFFLLKKK